MLDFYDKIHIGIIAVVDFFAVMVNSLYIFIILKKTSKELSTYAIILLNVACVDLLSAFSNFMIVDRVITVEGSIVFVYIDVHENNADIGPCTLANAQVCHFFTGCHGQFISQSMILLMISFISRLSLLKSNFITNQNRADHERKIRLTCGFVALFSTFIMVVFYMAGSYEVPGIATNLTISALNLSGYLTQNILPRITFLSMFFPVTLGFVAIIESRRRLFARLQMMSSADSYSHQHIYRSLTAQMLLPLAYLIGMLLWFLDAAGLVHSRMLQRTILAFTSFFPIASPLINMYYIPPYRKYLKSAFRSSNQVKSLEAMNHLSFAKTKQ